MQSEEGTDWLLELLTELQLQQYFLRIRDELNVTRLSHFEYVKNEDLEKIGMGRPGALHPPPKTLRSPPHTPRSAAPRFFGGAQRDAWSQGMERGFFLGEGTPVLVTAPLCCRPAAAVGGGEAEESHVQEEILDEQGTAGTGAGRA